jgi:hypothetical protein
MEVSCFGSANCVPRWWRLDLVGTVDTVDVRGLLRYWFTLFEGQCKGSVLGSAISEYGTPMQKTAAGIRSRSLSRRRGLSACSWIPSEKSMLGCH